MPQCPASLGPSVALIHPEQLPHSYRRIGAQHLSPAFHHPQHFAKRSHHWKQQGHLSGCGCPMRKGPGAVLQALVPPPDIPGQHKRLIPAGSRGALQHPAAPCGTRSCSRRQSPRADCTHRMHRTHRTPRTHHMLVLRSHPEGRTQTPFVAFPSY